MRMLVFFYAKHLDDLSTLVSKCLELIPINSFSHVSF